MLYFNGIDISEGIDVNRTSTSPEYDICHYWYFLNYSFKFQPNVCNICRDLFMSLNLSNIAILKVENADYCSIITRISKKEAVNLLENIDLTEKVENYKTKYHGQFWSCKFTSNSNLNVK